MTEETLPAAAPGEAARSEAVGGSNPAYGVTMINDMPATAIRFEPHNQTDNWAVNVQFMMGRKRVATLEGLDETRLRQAVGDKNADAIIAMTHAHKDRGTLSGEELSNHAGLTPAEAMRREEVEKAKATLAPELDDAAAVNRIEHDPQPERAVIDTAEFLARTAFLRARDREAWEASQGAPRTAQEPRAATPDMDALPQEPEKRQAALQDLERERRSELVDQLHAQFRVSGARFMFKDQPGKVAFKDQGDAIASSSNDERVARAMATMADAKGWKSIKVSGHPDFMREVWLEASLRGIEVKGYKPQEQDVRLLEERRDRMMHNTVSRDAERELQRDKQAPPKDQDKTPDAGKFAVTESTQRATRIAENVKTTVLDRNPEPDKPEALRSLSGTLVGHGSAPYNFDKNENPNYYVKLATASGEKTVWGVDLKRALDEGKANVGDDIRLDYLGNQPVKVKAPVRDDAGKVVGSQEIETMRNTWRAEKTERAQVIETLAQALVDAKVTDPNQRAAIMQAVNVRLQERQQAGTVPPVQMYDKAAPSQAKAAELPQPQQRRNMERTR